MNTKINTKISTKIPALVQQWTNLNQFKYYLDSVNGNDLDSGLSPSQAKKTIAALPEIVSGDKIGIAKGSYFREELNLHNINDLTIGSYGFGAKPIIDCADQCVSANFVKDGGYTNVYQYIHAHQVESLFYLSMWENGLRLKYVTSLALVDSTPGSYYVPTSSGAGNITFYVHTSDSSSPITNTKIYDASTRNWGLVVNNNCTVFGLHTKRNAHPNGSTEIHENGTVYDCVFEDGAKHNFFINYGTVTDCFAWKADEPSRVQYAMFVGYSVDGRGKSVVWERCTARGSNTTDGGSAFTNHTSGNSMPFDSVSFIDCSVTFIGQAFGANNTIVMNATRCFASVIGKGFVPESTTANIVNCRIDGYDSNNNKQTTRSIDSTSSSLNISGLRANVNRENDAVIYGAGVINITKSAISILSGSTGWQRFVLCRSTGVQINSTYNVVNGMDTLYSCPAGSYIIASENNVVSSNTLEIKNNNVAYSTFYAYKSANATLDINSVVGDPLFIDPSVGNYSLQEGSPAIAIGAGLENNNIVYTEIPASA